MTTSAAGFALPSGFDPLAEHGRVLEAVLTALERVEEQLTASLEFDDVFSQTATRHLASAGGKRVRPVLTVLASLLGDAGLAEGQVGEVGPETRQAAVVMELTHLATLYHDDVMDEAPVRRGAPAAHRLWGNSQAILAGDLIFARASQLMAELGPRPVRIQAETFERLVQGQLWETRGPDEGQDLLEHYYRVLRGKTGSLIAAAGVLGAYLGGADETAVQVMADYGEKVGLAFQLADDLIDLTSSAEELGKTPGTDLREHVPTLSTILVARAAAGEGPEADDARRVLALVDGPLDTDEQLAAAVAALTAHPAFAEAGALTRRWAEEAKAALAPLPESVVTEALAAFADYVVSRAS
ncbi:polyprenyl synthetase family protein [Micrococcus porci]|uniref:polyprenyl synthetase family protein n=1 Tax=Micrococcus TaxID=1269 RepID=UPI001CCF3BB6|nr:polyprenyl synthetase family protein [Micrococcus porci]MCG7422911.1 polyprenyl synthetase family protein [Micrococcus sp. ACRRV]UBH25576.1 polyprenyl synthetase family protein [Micrococcus porci]